MNEKDKINNIIQNLSDSTNKELEFCLEFLTKDFEQTKSSIIKLTKHLDAIEIVYNNILKEYKKRVKI
jgi:hypothetical protein